MTWDLAFALVALCGSLFSLRYSIKAYRMQTELLEKQKRQRAPKGDDEVVA